MNTKKLTLAIVIIAAAVMVIAPSLYGSALAVKQNVQKCDKPGSDTTCQQVIGKNPNAVQTCTVEAGHNGQTPDSKTC